VSRKLGAPQHAWLKSEGIDYKYDQKTKEGADKYWELGKCLRYDKCPLEPGAIKNLEFLLELRHEIEHRSTNRIDDAVGGELQACCINFNTALKSLFGPQFGLERRLPIALQFVSFGVDQRTRLKAASELPPHVSSFVKAFKNGLTGEQLLDPAFRFRVAFVPISSNRATASDAAIEFIKPGSEDSKAVSEVLFKEINKKRYTATKIVEIANLEEFPKFSMHDHTILWKKLGAKNPNKGYGCKGDYANTWVWFDLWRKRVLEHCEEQGELYRAN